MKSIFTTKSLKPYTILHTMKVLSALGILVLIQAARASEEEKSVCCDEETSDLVGCFFQAHPYGHLPLPKCPLDIPPEFLLYTPENTNDDVLITRDFIPSQFSPTRKTIFLVHGWQGSGTDRWIRDSRKALLDRDDFNVIQVGWKRGAGDLWYPQSASNTRAIGSEIALIANRLKDYTGISDNLLWCVGFSLGAHVCGIAGMITNFERITGLDPAGPEFESYDIMAGVNPTSANLVDIIHTDGRSLIMAYGTLRPLGHYDFYPNRGHGQPGCITYYGQKDDDQKRNRGNVWSCSHGRAPEYWIESIEMDCYISREACTDSEDIPRSCSECAGGDTCAYMGFAADKSPRGGDLYYLKTGNGWFWSDFCQW